jgi:tripartite-type tricarboxylate transporter receptor subunit TctC
MRRITCSIILVISVLLLFGAAGNVHAQGLTTKPIRIIVPWPAGGSTDVYARIIAQGLTEILGQQVLVDNRPGGASGIMGSEMVTKAPPDGYTLLVTPTHHVINASLYKKLPYHPVNDFTPLCLVGTNPSVILAHPSFPGNTIKELIALAKEKPGQLNICSNAVGGGNHLAAELFKSMAGIDILHIPYNGQAPAMNDLLAGHVALMMTSFGLTASHIKAGKLKALGTTSSKRSEKFPDVPTIGETVPGYEAYSWWGVWGPPKMPKDIVNKLNTAIVKVLNTPAAQKRFSDLDLDLVGNTPEQFAAFQKLELDKWAIVVKKIGLKLD